jgi:GT2 family glycosyltransferase
MKTKIAILIPVHNKIDLTKKCLLNLHQQISIVNDKIHSHIIVIDDGSTDSTSQWIHQHYPEVIILKGDGNLWWSGAINLGAHYAVDTLNCDYVLLWNNDIHAAPDYFNVLADLIDKTDKNIIIGSKIFCDSDFKIVWSMGGNFNPFTGKLNMTGYFKEDKSEWQKPVEADWLPGMGTLIAKEVMERTGYWDAERFPQYYGDTDFTYRAKLNGFKNLVFPQLKIINDVANSGIKKINEFTEIIVALTNIKSLHNIRINFMFYRLYAKSIKAYFTLIENYFYFFGGLVKRKIKSIFCRTNFFLF